jgi:SOS response regulatory protein OraA/RecX
VERARAVLRGRTASDRASRDKLVRKLVSRGFDLQTALAAVDSAADDEQAL